MKEISLRPFQQELKQNTYNALNKNHRNVLTVLPTGGGKSVIMSDITLDYYKQKKRVAIIAHRNELVTQMSSHIARRGIEHKIVGARNTVSQAASQHKEEFGRSFINPTGLVSVIGVDTLVSRKDELKESCKQIDLWLMDEAHHCIGNERVPPNKWGKAVQMFTNAHGIGFTATPKRADGQGLGFNDDGCFNFMVEGPGTRWLMDNNYLCDYEVVCPTSDLDLDDAPLSKDGDWSTQTLKKAAKKSKIVGDVVSNYCRWAFGRRAIIFATDVETAKTISQQFNDLGIKAAALDGTSLTAYRNQKIKEFSLGKISILVNVDLFDEGFDVPACDVVIMARPTASLSKYLQMVGRGLRYTEGKTALIIDHVSNIIRHKLPDKKREWSLSRRDKRAKTIKHPDEIELTICTSSACAKPYEKFRQVCPYCGFERPLPDPRSRSIEMVEGDLVLLDKTVLDRMRAAAVLETPSNMASRVGAAAGPIAAKGIFNRQNEKIESHENLKESIAQWAAIERLKGFSDREIQKKFYLTLGIDVLSALDNSRTKKEFEDLSTTIRGWYETVL